MTTLLKCQEELAVPDTEYLRTFAIALLCHLLDIFESDLTASESADIDRFIEEYTR